MLCSGPESEEAERVEGDVRANDRAGEERTPGFRLGIYVFKDAEIVDFAAPYGVFSVARRYDPDLDAFLVTDAMRPVQTQAGFTVLPNYSEIVDFAAPYGVFSVARRYDPDLDAFLVTDAMRPVQTQAGFTVLPNYS